MILTVKSRNIEKKTKYDIKKKIRSEPLIYIVKIEKQPKIAGGILELRSQERSA